MATSKHQLTGNMDFDEQNHYLKSVFGADRDEQMSISDGHFQIESSYGLRVGHIMTRSLEDHPYVVNNHGDRW